MNDPTLTIEDSLRIFRIKLQYYQIYAYLAITFRTVLIIAAGEGSSLFLSHGDKLS
jgi:hypothetical protein